MAGRRPNKTLEERIADADEKIYLKEAELKELRKNRQNLEEDKISRDKDIMYEMLIKNDMTLKSFVEMIKNRQTTKSSQK